MRVRSEFQRLKLKVAALSLYLAAAPRPVAGSFLRSQKNQPSSKTAAPSSSELPSADERSQLQPGLASRALAIAVAHGLLVCLNPPKYLRAFGRWRLVWPLRVQLAPLCREVANAHRARTPTDLGAAYWYRGRGARRFLRQRFQWQQRIQHQFRLAHFIAFSTSWRWSLCRS